MDSTQRRHGHEHTHGHDHDEDIDWAAMAGQLELGATAESAATTAAFGWLREPSRAGVSVGRVLDVGSGAGVDTCLFAELFGEAEIVAVDGSEGLLEQVRLRAAAAGLGERIATVAAQLPEEFAKLPEADLIWSRRTVHHLGDQQAGLVGLAGRLRPGGVLAVAEGGLPPRFLPRDIGMGRPGLQARLDAAEAEAFSRMRAELPGSVPVSEDWPALLAAAGLRPSGSRTFLTEWTAPLERPVREYLRGYLNRLREGLAEQLDETDVATVDALLDERAATGILSRPDAFLLSATTVHTARAEG